MTVEKFFDRSKFGAEAVRKQIKKFHIMINFNEGQLHEYDFYINEIRSFENPWTLWQSEPDNVIRTFRAEEKFPFTKARGVNKPGAILLVFKPHRDKKVIERRVII